MAEYKKEDWRVKELVGDIASIANYFSISEILAHIILNRGISKKDEITQYLRDDFSYTHNPALLKDMEKGCNLIKEKILAGKAIRIISDYDVDGITSNYILYRGLQMAGADVSYDIPDRIRDGYGMNCRLVDVAYADKIDTIITCDNGIAAVEAVRHAKELGMTVVVTDHHELPCEVGENDEKHYIYVDADAVIDPHRPDCEYPYKNLCGAGVAYKFIRHLYEVMHLPWEEEDAYMDVLALGTVCDVMPLTDENRIFVKHGLRKLQTCDNIGLCALKKALNLENAEIEAYHLAFRIGPCLNSTGRLESAKEGVRLLLTHDSSEAERLAVRMAKLNEERKAMTDRAVRLARELVCSNERILPTAGGVKRQSVGDDTVLVLYIPEIHESIAGLVASKIKEAFYRPTLVFTDAENGMGLKGSGRSIEAYNMFAALSKHRELFVKVGGHPMAAGFTILPENLEALRKALNETAALTTADLTEKLYVDAACPIENLTLELYEELKKLEPYGVANPHPLFGALRMGIRQVKMVGNEQQYAKCTFVSSTGKRIEGMVFRGKELLDNIKEWFGEEECDKILKGLQNHVCIDILYHLKKNEYQNRITMQIEPASIRKSAGYQG